VNISSNIYAKQPLSLFSLQTPLALRGLLTLSQEVVATRFHNRRPWTNAAIRRVATSQCAGSVPAILPQKCSQVTTQHLNMSQNALKGTNQKLQTLRSEYVIAKIERQRLHNRDCKDSKAKVARQSLPCKDSNAKILHGKERT
jgi:hypothetical protein